MWRQSLIGRQFFSRTLSLDARLRLLTLAAILPLLIFILGLQYFQYRADVDQTGREKLALARNMAQAIDRELQARIAMMQVLTLSQRLRNSDFDGFRDVARSFVDEQFPGANILVLRESGQQVMNLAIPAGQPLPSRQNLDTIRKVFATGKPVVSDLFLGVVVRRPVIAIDVPVRATDGRVGYVLTMNPSPDAFGELIRRYHLEPNWIISVFDSQGATVARAPDPERFIGQKPGRVLQQLLLDEREGIFDSVSREGIPILAVFSRTEAFNWTVSMGVPRSDLTGPAISTALWTLSAGIFLLVTSLGLASIVGRQITKPIAELRNAAASDDDAAVPLSPTGLAEVDEVGVALTMARNRRRLSERRYHLLFDAIPHAVCVYDMTTLKFLEVNEATVRQYGWSREEFLKMSLRDIRPPEEQSRLREALVGPARAFYQMRHWKKDGTLFDVVAVSRTIRLDKGPVGLAMSHDITEQNVTRARLDEAIRAFPGTYRLYDSREVLVLTNDVSWEPGGTDHKPRVGETAEAIARSAAESEADVASIGRQEEWLRERLAQFRRANTDIEMRSRDGRWFQLLERRTADSGTISVRIDITARKAIEDQLRQSQKLETIGQLAGGIAHDFNNSLAAIMFSLDNVLDLVAKDSEAYESAETAMEATEQAASLTRRLLALSRREELAPTDTDVAAVVTQLEKLLRSSIPVGLKLVVRAAVNAGHCVLDRTQLESAIMNLVVNARDAIGGAGTITIEAAGRTIDEEEAAASLKLRAGRWTVVSVTDDGSGIPEEILEKIMEPFFTTKPVGKGTGLGLSQIHGFVTQAGGFLLIESQVGQGTTFSMHFPTV